jgi:UDP-N-acetylmuramoyl-tripeptide--D-alanyl-D-alanine ligase
MTKDPKVTDLARDLEPRLTPRFVSEALGVPILPDLSRVSGEPFSSIVTDSRKIQTGCLFVALKGDKFDGHDFIPQAVTGGARGILCRRGATTVPQAQKGLHVFAVDDTLEAYRELAFAWRREFSIPLVAVAGSVGKTTTKEFLAALLRGRWNEVLKTEGSQNGFVGIPMTLLKLEATHGAAVIEVGIDEPGVMEDHMALVRASAGVLTAIGPEHLEKLRDVPTIAREEGAALQAIDRDGGLVAINLDDSWIKPHFTTLKGARKIAYTLGTQSGDKILQGKVSGDGKQIKLTGLGLKGESFELPLAGEHNARNFLAAAAVAAGIGLSAEEIATGLKTFQGPEGRSQIREIAGKSPIVCDYYNANPDSTVAGLKLLVQTAKERKSGAKIACLADMLELGKDEEKYHRALATSLIDLGIENVLLYGERMKWLLEELKSRGYSGQASHFDDQTELSKSLRSVFKSGDAVLIKGSHGMHMEEVWKALEASAGK